MKENEWEIGKARRERHHKKILGTKNWKTEAMGRNHNMEKTVATTGGEGNKMLCDSGKEHHVKLRR